MILPGDVAVHGTDLTLQQRAIFAVSSGTALSASICFVLNGDRLIDSAYASELGETWFTNANFWLRMPR